MAIIASMSVGLRFMGVCCALTACAHFGAPARDPQIDFEEIAPTADGVVLRSLLTREELDGAGAPVAGIEWHGGSVLFFNDRVICTRDGRNLGVTISANYDAEPDLAARLVRIDYGSAEVEALESGIEAESARLWIIFTTANGASSRAKALDVARAFARAGIKNDIAVSILDSDRERIEIALLGRDNESMLTDRLPAIVVGPPMASRSELFHVLHEGPGEVTRRFTATHAAGIRIFSESGASAWAYAGGEHHEQALRWKSAMESVWRAMKNGCVVE